MKTVRVGLVQMRCEKGAIAANLDAISKLTIEDEETEWFSPGDTVPVFSHAGITFGIAICADLGRSRSLRGPSPLRGRGPNHRPSDTR